jgi:CRP-like cAMP-binding protein
MYPQLSHPDLPRPFLTWQRIIDWANEHYHCHTFNKDDRIPVRPGLLYLVQRGAIRLVSEIAPSPYQNRSRRTQLQLPEEIFLGFVGTGQPFEVVSQPPYRLQSYAHVDQTIVIWMYWTELDNWPHFRQEVLEAFRYQHQRKQLWLCVLGQRRTIDRLHGFLKLLIEEYGEPCPKGYYLPWTLTHTQIGNAIGTTRVTVTRLMGKLRKQGLITSYNDMLCLPPGSES